MKVNQAIRLALLILAGLPGSLFGQAMAEHAASPSAVPTVAVVDEKSRESINSTLKNAGKMLDKAQIVSSSRSRPACEIDSIPFQARGCLNS